MKLLTRTGAPVPEGRFTLRVKAFHAESEAARFAHDLASRGHAAFVQSGASDTGRVFEVLVGGFAQREEAERFQRGFEHSEAIDGTSLVER